MFPCRLLSALSQTPAPRTTPSLYAGFRRRHLAAAATLAACALAGAPLQAQTAHFSGAVNNLTGPLSFPERVARDANGNLYISDQDGGEIYEYLAVNGKIPASPTVRNLGGTSFESPNGIAVDASGNVFVADSGNSRVREMLAVNGSIPTSPTIVTLGSGFLYPTGVAVDKSGDVFVTDSDSNKVSEIEAVNGKIPTSPTIITVGSGFVEPQDVTIDANGNLYIADTTNHEIKEMLAVNGKISASPTIVTLGSGFSSPHAVAVDSAGNVFVADADSDAIEEIVAVNGTTSASSTVVDLGSGFESPDGVAVDAAGNVFLVDTGTRALDRLQTAGVDFGSTSVNAGSSGATPVIFTFDAPGTFHSTNVTTFGATGEDFSAFSQGGSCTADADYGPGDSCTVDLAFLPWEPGLRLGALQLLSSSGSVIAAAPLHGIGIGPEANYATFSSCCLMPASQGTFGSGFLAPTGVAVDGDENIFVADGGTNKVQEVLYTGGYTTVQTLGSGFNNPHQLAVDGAGNVYVADTGNHAVKEILAAGGYTTVLTLGSGFFEPFGVAVDGNNNVFVGDPGVGSVTEIESVNGVIPASPVIRTLASGVDPAGVAVDSSGNLFYLDFGLGAVQKMLAVNGVIPASPTIQSYGSGFTAQGSIALDPGGRVYVADNANSAVADMVYSVSTQTLAGGFASPQGIAVDSYGTVIVANTGYGSVNYLDYSVPPSESFATTAVGATSTDSPKQVAVLNNGTAALQITGVTYATDFPEKTGTTGDCTASLNVAAEGFCTLSIDFTPQGSSAKGPSTALSEVVQVNTNSLNASTTGTVLVGGTVTTSPDSLITPTPGSTLPGSTVTFTWTAATGATTYALNLGTTGAGSSNLYNSGHITTTTATAKGLPTTGVTVYAELWAYLNNKWVTKNYTYSAATVAALTSPTPGSTFTSSAVTFTWTPTTGATTYALNLGSTGVNSSNLYNSGHITTTSATATGLPVNGEKIYAELWAYANNAWVTTNYTFTAYLQKAALTSPTPGSTLSGSSVTFTWTPASGATTYALNLGTTGANSSNLYNSGHITATSATVSGLPVTGATIYAELWAYVNNAWVTTNYTYTAFTQTTAAITSPAPGSTLMNGTQTFTWTPATGATFYALNLGSTGANSSNLYNSGHITATSVTVTGLPINGNTIYAELWAYVGNKWVTTNYTYATP